MHIQDALEFIYVFPAATHYQMVMLARKWLNANVNGNANVNVNANNNG